MLVVDGVHYKLWDQETLDVICGEELDYEAILEWLNEIGNSKAFIAVKTDVNASYPDFIKANTIEKLYIKEY